MMDRGSAMTRQHRQENECLNGLRSKTKAFR